MPTYEYVCQKCDHRFEVFQPISAEPLATCLKEHCIQPRWGKGKVRRAISGGAGFLFKGSGFYITDYRSESYKQAASKESGAATATSSSASASNQGSTAASDGKKDSASPAKKETAPAKKESKPATS